MNINWLLAQNVGTKRVVVSPKQFVVGDGTFCTSPKLEAEGFFPFELSFLYENKQLRHKEHLRNIVDFSIFDMRILEKSDSVEEEVK